MYRYYRVYGLTVASELPLLELPRLPDTETVAIKNVDIRIRAGHVSFQPED